MGARWLRAFAGASLAVALTLPGALAEPGLDARLESLRELRVELTGTTLSAEAPLWRAAADADGSGSVSSAEVATFVSVLETLAAGPEVGVLEAYNLTWAAENASGAAGATLDGRANLSAFVLERAPVFRVQASLDGTFAKLARLALTFKNLSGSVGGAVPLEVLQQSTFEWGPPPADRTVRRVEIAAPARLAFHMRVAGGLEIIGFESLVPGALAPDHSAVEGVTIEFPAVVSVRVREVSNAALAVVIGATLLPALGVAYVTLVSARKMRVAENPLPVEPQFR